MKKTSGYTDYKDVFFPAFLRININPENRIWESHRVVGFELEQPLEKGKKKRAFPAVA
jgi:hypothetical protein